jgi:drug/metabolite transporter (DMT)-like permease
LIAAPLTAGESAARLRGIAVYCVAFLCFACLDTIAKYTSHFVPAIEVAWIRFVTHAIFAVVALRPWRNLATYRMRRPVLQIVRSVLLFASTVFNFIALLKLQLAETTSINFASALVVAALAGPFLGEWIGPRRWAAIGVGFLGVLIVTRPGTSAFQLSVLLAIGSMLCNCFYVILTRLMTGTESAGTMLVYPALVATLFLAPAALPSAVLPPTPFIALLLAMTGLFGAVGHWCLIEAHRLAPAPVLSPFVYTQIIWMVGLGYLVFGDVPHPLTLGGAAIIIASGLYILYRQRVHGDR